MTIVGIHPWERTDKQRVILNVEIEFDGSKAAYSDDIADTIDYAELSQGIIDHVESSQYLLVEKLAQSVLDLIMALPQVERASVELDKPMAIAAADSTSVLVTAKR